MAPLFHGTNLLSLAAIIASNKLNAAENWGRPNEPTGPRLSRSFKVAMSFAMDNEFGMGGVLVLDQQRISHNHKIVPYADVDFAGDRWSNEFEEVPITGALSPLSNYLISININPALIQETMDDEDAMNFGVNDNSGCVMDIFSSIEECHLALENLLNHPKLNRFDPRGRWTNIGFRSGLN